MENLSYPAITEAMATKIKAVPTSNIMSSIEDLLCFLFLAIKLIVHDYAKFYKHSV